MNGVTVAKRLPRWLVAVVICSVWFVNVAVADQETGNHETGMSFRHLDWQLICDNTRTCRAAGYQSYPSTDNVVSVLLTRKAGANQPVLGEVTFGFKGMPRGHLVIDNHPHEWVDIDPETERGLLNAQQVKVLLAALRRDSRIQWLAHPLATDSVSNQAALDTDNHDEVWTLSDAGASAVLLKMDEYQGRIGTTGALIRRGNANEDRVLPALPMPVVVKATDLENRTFEIKLSNTQFASLRANILATITNRDFCPLLEDELNALHSNNRGHATITVETLTTQQALLPLPCWRAAYNTGSGMWLVDIHAPHEPQLITTDATNYELGHISSHQKGRGVGDCWGVEEWIWDGTEFVHTQSYSTGLCRGIVGGAWRLPTLVTEVQ